MNDAIIFTHEIVLKTVQLTMISNDIEPASPVPVDRKKSSLG